MTESHGEWAGRAAEMRAAFDRGFARAVADQADRTQMVLILRVGRQRHAVLLDELLAIEHRRKIVPLPSKASGLLGLAGFRGQLVPVLSLASLLQSPDEAESPAWLAFARGPMPLAFAFDRLEGSTQVPTDDIFLSEPDAAGPTRTRQTVRLGSEVLPMLDMPSLSAAARERLGGRRRGERSLESNPTAR